MLVAASWRHVGYIMVLYLAGLKSVDPTLREAAKVDGASERQTFFRVVFPVMAPINVVIVVITVIESLRAFDIVYIINRGKNGLELLSTLITNNSISESNRVGFGSAIAVVLLVDLARARSSIFLTRMMREDGRDARPPEPPRRRSPAIAGAASGCSRDRRSTASSSRWPRSGCSRSLWAVYTSLRPYADTQLNGYVSLAERPQPRQLRQRLEPGRSFPHFYLNTLIVAVPAVILMLLRRVDGGVRRDPFQLSASTCSLLMLFTAGNLLPPQVIIVPFFRLYLLLPGVPQPLSDNGAAVRPVLRRSILIHIVFQTGFCVFVLSNYMKTISKELTEAALVDGARVWTIYRRIILPLCRPALAALATLEFTFIYNDFFWALMLMKTGDKRPITSALNNLQGQFFTDNNLLAAGAFLVAIPTILVYLVLQKQFVAA